MTCHTLARSSYLFRENEFEANNRLLVKDDERRLSPPQVHLIPTEGNTLTLQLQRCMTSSSFSSLIAQLNLQSSACGLWQNIWWCHHRFWETDWCSRWDGRGTHKVLQADRWLDMQDTRWEDWRNILWTSVRLMCLFLLPVITRSSQIPAYEHY